MIIRRHIEQINAVRQSPNAVKAVVVRGAVVVAQRFGVVNMTRIGARKITADFDYSNFTTTLTLGAVASGSVVVSTVLEVTQAFNAGALTIGSQTAQGILMTTGEIDITTIAKFQRNNYLELNSAETFKAFFTGSPTQGIGKITTIILE